MSLMEELIESYRMDGVEDAISSGAVVTREEYERRMEEQNKQLEENLEKQIYEDAVNLVRILMKKGFSLEESLQEAPEQYRESIRNDLQKE